MNTRIAIETLRIGGCAPICVFVLHTFLALVLEAYDRFPPLDVPIHVLGGTAMAYFCAQMLRVFEESGIAARASRFFDVVCILA